jgi:predicted unusual protein kinase regulating ubiquinone biosynthesis (AarF/ABC1/UbiB family)
VMGVGTKDTERVIKAYQMMDLLLPNADLDLIRKMEEKAFEQFWGLDMTELSGISFEEMHEFSKEFRQIIYEMPFQVPQNIIFLGRCVGILSGICTGLDSRFNLWDHLAPYADSLIAEEARTNPKFWLGEIEKYIQTLVMMPYQMNNTLQKIEKDLINVHNPELKEQVESLERSIRLIPGWIIYLALFLGGVQLYISGRDHLAIISFSASGVLLLWLFWRGKT